MKALVTGASGFIGSFLVRELLQRGHHVLGLVRSKQKAEQLRKVGATPVEGDLTSPESLTGVAGNIDVIFHLASVPPTEKNREIQRKVNLEGCHNLLQVTAGKVRLFVYASGLGVFGEVHGSWVDENTRINPHTRYVQTRWQAEQLLLEASRENRLPLVIVRFGEVYGPGGWFESILLERLRRGRFRIPGSGKYFRSFVHVEDATRALVLLGEKMPTGENFVIVDDEPTTFENFVNFTANQLGIRPPGRVPVFLAKMAVGGDFVKLLTVSIKARNEKVKRILGLNLRYPTYRDGIPSSIAQLTR